MPVNYKYDPEVYIPAAIRYGYITLPEARAEYSRLRSAAVKRLQRLSRTEGRLYSAYRMYGKEGFAPLPKDATPAEVGRALADVYHFLEMKTSSVNAIRESQRRALKTLNERGYTFINKSNIREFGEFMEEARQQKVVSNNRGGSPTIVELYETVKRLQIPPEQVQRRFSYWLSKRKELEAMPTPKPGTKISSDSVQVRLLIQDARKKENKPIKKKRR